MCACYVTYPSDKVPCAHFRAGYMDAEKGPNGASAYLYKYVQTSTIACR